MKKLSAENKVAVIAALVEGCSRMSMRRFTRLTNGFSKKIENHEHMVAYMNYNFVRVHQTLKTTPTVAAGVSQKAWTLADIVTLSEMDLDLAA